MKEGSSFLKTITVREVFLFGVCLFLAYCAFVKKWDNVQLAEDKIRAMERISSLEKQNELQQHISDSLRVKAEVTERIIAIQKQDTKLITKKYEKIKSDINLLSSDSSISYLSNRLSQEGSH